MKSLAMFDSLEKPNLVIVRGGYFIVLEISPHRLILDQVDKAPETNSPFYAQHISINGVGLFGVYGTSMDNIKVEKVD
jgi:hypothetical protein